MKIILNFCQYSVILDLYQKCLNGRKKCQKKCPYMCFGNSDMKVVFTLFALEETYTFLRAPSRWLPFRFGLLSIGKHQIWAIWFTSLCKTGHIINWLPSIANHYCKQKQQQIETTYTFLTLRKQWRLIRKNIGISQRIIPFSFITF